MGFLDGLLMLPLAPVRGVAWLGEELAEMAYRQATDPTLVRGRLAEIEEAREAGGLSDEEAEELEGPLLRLLVDSEGGLGAGGDVTSAR
jgi:Gas vesicle protein G